jgi:hypothetical protein
MLRLLETFRPARRTLPTSGQGTYFDRVQVRSRSPERQDQCNSRKGWVLAGLESDVLLRSVEHDEIALRIIQWLTSSGHLPPP